MAAVRPPPCASRALLLLFLAMACALVPAAWAREQGSTLLERGVKAAFLYKFVAYVTWPEGSFARSDAPVVIGVAGDDALVAALREVIASRSVEGRPLVVRRVQDADTLGGLHILFVGRDEAARLSELARALANQPVLLVSENEGALEQGSAINFVLAEGRVKFDIAPDAAERRGIKLSSRLLTVAQTLRSSPVP